MIKSEYKNGSQLSVFYHFMATAIKTGAPVEMPIITNKDGAIVNRLAAKCAFKKIKQRHFPSRSFSILTRSDGGLTIKVR